MNRHLDQMEIPFLGHDASLVAKYEGDLDDNRLADAFALMGRMYPVLRGVVRGESTDPILAVESDSKVKFSSAAGDWASFKAAMQSNWNPRANVACLVHRRDGRSGHVGLRIDHSVADADALVTFWRSFWSVYAGGRSSISSHDVWLPSAPYELLESRWNGIPPARDRLGDLWSTFDSYSISNQEVSGRNVGSSARGPERERRHIVLTEPETSRFVKRAREHGTSVHGILCGAILVAQRAVIDADGPVPMLCQSVVNLRSRVTPRVGSAETTNFDGTVSSVVELGMSADSVAVGRQVKKQLERSISQRRYRLNCGDDFNFCHPRLGAYSQRPLSRFWISNAAPCPSIDIGAGVLEFTPFFLISERGPDVDFPQPPMYGVYTFGGCLRIDAIFNGPYEVSTIDSVIDQIEVEIYRLINSFDCADTN